MDQRSPIPWTEAEPTRFEVELAAMTAIAPKLVWDDALLLWEGLVPAWPFARPQPPELDAFLGGRRFTAQVIHSQAFPMVPARVIPLEPEPPLEARTMHAWHVNGDGSLCLLRSAAAWDGTETAAELVVKAAGWFIELRLMQTGQIEAMSARGIASDDSFDHLIVASVGLDT